MSSEHDELVRLDEPELAAHLVDAGDVPADDASGCVHEDAVYWNPYNRVVQCHRCGIVFVPAFSPTATYR